MFEDTTNQETPSDTEQSSLDATEVDNESSATDDLLSGEGSETTEQPAEENEDIEVDGKKFALPKSAAEKLKAERMMHGDYTRKTQEVAEQRRAVEAQAQEVQKSRQDMQQYIGDVAKVQAIDEQLAAYQNADWQSIIDADPVQALKHQQQFQQLQFQRQQALNTLAQKQQQHALNEQQSIAKQAQEAEAYFQREIPNWSPARSDALMKYGIDQGIPAQLITQSVLKTPAFAKLIHKAELYDQIAKKQAPVVTPPAQAKPAAKVGNNASVKKDPSNMTDAEFDAYRRRVQSNRRK